MSYTASLFASGETLVTSARQHWFILVWKARWAILALILAFLLVLFRVVNGGSGVLFDILGYVALAAFVYGIASAAWGWLEFRAQEYVITTRRLIHVSGVINKRATDSSLEKINDAILTESLFGRLFGFGDLEVLTASDSSGIEKLQMLRDAKEFKKSMLEAKHDLELEISRPTMPPLRASQPTSSADGGATDRFSPPPAAPAREPEPAPAVPTPAPAPAPAPQPASATPAAPAGPAPMSSEQVADALNRLGDLRDRGIVTLEEFEAKKAELLARL
jgi:hypothetical protein